MKFVMIVMLAGMGLGTMANAQSPTVAITAVSPALGADSFKAPMVCTRANMCAVVSPALGNRNVRDVRQAEYSRPPVLTPVSQQGPILLAGPTARPAN